MFIYLPWVMTWFLFSTQLEYFYNHIIHCTEICFLGSQNYLETIYGIKRLIFEYKKSYI